MFQTTKGLKNRIKQLEAELEGYEDGVNPFNKVHIKTKFNEIEDNECAWSYFFAALNGRIEFDEIEEHLEKCFRENVSTDIYIERLDERA